MKNITPLIAKNLSWYEQNQRKLPWRHIQNPYKIWISEIILQQTRVVQAIPYYFKIVEKFPTICDMAKATRDEVMKVWQGLGYYTRCNNMHETAQKICHEYGGVFPLEIDEIKKLKGVGDYTAAAIYSILTGKNTLALDGNVLRVLTRVFAFGGNIALPSTRNHLKTCVEPDMIKFNGGEINQSFIELGATICLPRNPKCIKCPLMDDCLAFGSNTVEKFPVKSKKKAKKPMFIHYFLMRYQNKYLLVKRRKNKLWNNLYELPNIETETQIKLVTNSFFLNNEWNIESKQRPKLLQKEKHLLTHREIFASFYFIELQKSFFMIDGIWTKISHISNFPVSILTANFLETYTQKHIYES